MQSYPEVRVQRLPIAAVTFRLYLDISHMLPSIICGYNINARHIT